MEIIFRQEPITRPGKHRILDGTLFKGDASLKLIRYSRELGFIAQFSSITVFLKIGIMSTQSVITAGISCLSLLLGS